MREPLGDMEGHLVDRYLGEAREYLLKRRRRGMGAARGRSGAGMEGHLV